MIMRSVNLKSLQALMSFREYLPVMVSTADSEVQEMLRQVHKALYDTEATLGRAYARLSAAEDELSCEEDPSEYDYEAVWKARDKVAQIQAFLETLQTACHTFEKAMDAFYSRLTQASVAGQNFLDERIEAARVYMSHTVSDSGDYSATLPRKSAVNVSNVVAPAGVLLSASGNSNPVPELSLAKAMREELPDLPRGLEWMSVEDIDWEEAPASLDFRKVTKAKITEMLKTFESDLLPVLAKQPNISQSELIEMDRKLNRLPSSDSVRSDSLLLCHGYMIGNMRESDLIVMDENTASSGSKFGFTSGRHRARAAKEMGWKFIPVRILGRRRK